MHQNRIRVKYSKLGRKRALGLAHTYDKRKPIEIDERIKGKKYLEILNHEILHILFPEKSEPEIEKAAIILTNTQWHEGIRRVDNSNELPLQDGSK